MLEGGGGGGGVRKGESRPHDSGCSNTSFTSYVVSLLQDYVFFQGDAF